MHRYPEKDKRDEAGWIVPVKENSNTLHNTNILSSTGEKTPLN